MTMDINTKIENALKDRDIVNIMHKACKRFANQLDQDVIYNCKLNALWKCFMYFKPDRNTKFTTYLYNGVFIECLKEIRFQNKYNKFAKKLHDNIPKKSNPYLIIDILDELKREEDKEMFLDRLSNMTIQEIADKNPIRLAQCKNHGT
jgi:hypothetical protein